MDYNRKLLSSSNLTSNARAEAPEAMMNRETDFVIVVAALVCALICVLGLVIVARCAFLRRGVESWSFGFGVGSSQEGNKGLKKRVLNSLPKYTHSAEGEEECAICLAEYGEGDVVRVLPQCGHTFHVDCIDTWLASHSSCPSCRLILLGTRCHKCGEFPLPSQPTASVPPKLTPFSQPASTSSITFLP